MNALRDAFDDVATKTKTIEVYATDETAALTFEEHFATRNVRIRHRRFPSTPRLGDGFVLVRNAEDEFLGAVGIDHLRRLVSPTIPIADPFDGPSTIDPELFDFLDNTLFTSYDRSQMLAITREIEDRAWRADAGVLYTGFQNAKAFAKQLPVYNRFARESGVRPRVFIEDDWVDSTTIDSEIRVISGANGEIGRFWFVILTGTGDERDDGCLLAVEREPGQYYGFWTHDPALLTDIVSYLESTYLEPDGPGDRHDI